MLQLIYRTKFEDTASPMSIRKLDNINLHALKKIGIIFINLSHIFNRYHTLIGHFKMPWSRQFTNLSGCRLHSAPKLNKMYFADSEEGFSRMHRDDFNSIAKWQKSSVYGREQWKIIKFILETIDSEILISLSCGLSIQNLNLCSLRFFVDRGSLNSPDV